MWYLSVLKTTGYHVLREFKRKKVARDSRADYMVGLTIKLNPFIQEGLANALFPSGGVRMYVAQSHWGCSFAHIPNSGEKYIYREKNQHYYITWLHSVLTSTT